MPKYEKFMKDILTKKKKNYAEPETVILDAKCSAIIQTTLPRKENDPGRVTLSVTIGDIHVGRGLVDLGSSINLIPLSMVDKFLFPVDFVVIDMEEDIDTPLILGRTFMKTARMMIDIDDGLMKEVIMQVEIQVHLFNPLEKTLTEALDVFNEDEEKEVEECLQDLDVSEEISPFEAKMEELKDEPKVDEAKLELKMLPSHLKYAFLEEGGKKPVIIYGSLSNKEEYKLIHVL
ncbi:uncharacterized protein LOC131640552 [Vicia villosa]|uniref:uncharacterized protein LOC131640552 n=1 Tax=Vicia villosa TaxID=3911 RepID=UPI00273B155E|nr:uncharacterized protein LOC131640552 [Vicia villosa]